MLTSTMIGHNLRVKRLERNLSQRAVGAYLNVSFQQVQKYESGANHVSSMRLFQLAQLYECGMDALCTSPDMDAIQRDSTPVKRDDYKVGMLMKYFSRIQCRHTREQICRIVDILSENAGNGLPSV